MGVQLGEIIPKRSIGIEHLAGRVVAIDAYNALYQFLSSIRQPDGTPLLDSRGRITSHLTGLLYRTARLVEAGVKPVYVFDGKPPEHKEKTLGERAAVRSNAHAEWRKALERGEIETAKRHAQAASRLTSEMAEEAKQLLERMGVAYVQAPGEGEAQAAHICANGDAYAVASQDYDALLFGAPLLVRNLTLAGKRKLPGRMEFVEVTPEMIELGSALAALGITREQLVWIALLIGTDYNEGVRGIGPKKALKLVQQCKTLDDVTAASGLENEAHVVEKIFLHPHVSDDYSLQWQPPDREALVKFLCEERSFARERVEKVAAALKEAFAAKQGRLGEWFG
jgi:flap endonuclease-1